MTTCLIDPTVALDEACDLIGTDHVDAVAALLRATGECGGEAHEVALDVLAASYVVAAERDEED